MLDIPLTEDAPHLAAPSALSRLDSAPSDPAALTIHAHLDQALKAHKAQDYQTASEAALKALALDERNGHGWYLLALAREKSGDPKSAFGAFELAFTLMPQQADIANDAGRMAVQLGEPAKAAHYFAIYHAARPTCIHGANNLAFALRELHAFDQAVEILRPAILANPEAALLWNALGTVLDDRGDAAEAIPFFEEALRLDPRLAKARLNLGGSKLALGDADGALADCNAAMTLTDAPGELAKMRLARSSILLCLGRLGEGWDDYEARLEPHFAGGTDFRIDRPRWDLQEDLSGKSLLLFGEQGLGDQVAHAGLVGDVLDALGADGRLTLAVEPRLIALFQRSFPGAIVVPLSGARANGRFFRTLAGLDVSDIDLWTPMGSLLRRFRRSIGDYPQRARSLEPDPARVNHWRGVLASLPGIKVGLVWKSLNLDGVRRKFFAPFEQWRPVLETAGVSFVNLQYGDSEREVALARSAGIEIWTPPDLDLKNDLDDIAALSCALDFVLGPSNATTSIAASCGAAVWMLTPPAAWTCQGTDGYPWYPQARAFSVGGHEGWDAVMGRMAAALAQAAACTAS